MLAEADESPRLTNSKPVLGPLLQAGPMVRIHSPPAVSRQTIGSSVAKPHLPFVMSQHSCMPELRLTMPPSGERTKPPIPPGDLLSGALIEVARDTRVGQRVDQDLDHSAFDLSGGERPPAVRAAATVRRAATMLGRCRPTPTRRRCVAATARRS